MIYYREMEFEKANTTLKVKIWVPENFKSKTLKEGMKVQFKDRVRSSNAAPLAWWSVSQVGEETSTLQKINARSLKYRKIEKVKRPRPKKPKKVKKKNDPRGRLLF